MPVPFAYADDDGRVDLTTVNKKRAVQCGLSRRCGMCGESLTFPLVFLGSPDEADAGLFARPPLHEACADTVPELVPEWADTACVRTTAGSFTLERPHAKGSTEPVLFRPGPGAPMTK